MAFNFYTPQGVDYIFSLFPDYYVEADTYKDVNGEGLLERYCRSFDQELEEIKPFIDEILLLLQPLLSDGKYLSYQAGNVGGIPLTSDIEINKRLTAWAVSLFKIRGCASSYELLFRLFDYQVKVIENFNDSRTAYDIEEPEIVRYDAEEFYYDNGCPACIEYSLQYVNYTNPMEVMSEETEAIIRSLICFIQPIDAKLTTISPQEPVDIMDLWDNVSYNAFPSEGYAVAKLSMTDSETANVVDDIVSTWVMLTAEHETLILLQALNHEGFKIPKGLTGFFGIRTQDDGGGLYTKKLVYFNGPGENYEPTAGAEWNLSFDHATTYNFTRDNIAQDEFAGILIGVNDISNTAMFVISDESGSEPVFYETTTIIEASVAFGDLGDFTLRVYHKGPNSTTTNGIETISVINNTAGIPPKFTGYSQGNQLYSRSLPSTLKHLIIGNYDSYWGTSFKSFMDQEFSGPNIDSIILIGYKVIADLESLNHGFVLGPLYQIFASLTSLTIKTSISDGTKLDDFLNNVAILMFPPSTSGGTLDIRTFGGSTPPTAASAAAISTLSGLGWTVVHD